MTRSLLVVVIDTNPVWWGKKVLTSQGNEVRISYIIAHRSAHDLFFRGSRFLKE